MTSASPSPQNVMPLSAGLFKSEHRNPVPQCPPRLHVQFLSHVLWSRMPNQFLKVDVSRVSERQGWLVQCVEPLQFMSLHIPEENRSAHAHARHLKLAHSPGAQGWVGTQSEVQKYLISYSSGGITLHSPSLNPFLNHFVPETKLLYFG